MRLDRSEQLTLQFYEWEQLGRGHLLFDRPIEIEPPYLPFGFNYKPPSKHIDDGRVPNLFQRIGKIIQGSPKQETKEEVVFSPQATERQDQLVGIQVRFPIGTEIVSVLSVEFINMLSYSESSISFEIVGTADAIRVQFICTEEDLNRIETHLKAYFPTVIIKNILPLELEFDIDEPLAIADFGLEKEFMCPILTVDSFKIDPLTSIIAQLENLRNEDVALFQIIFQGVSAPWASVIPFSVSDGQGGSFFSNSPEMPRCAEEKVSYPLFAVICRVAAQGPTEEDSQTLVMELAQSISQVSSSPFNALQILSNKGYAYEEHVENVFYRRSNRLGMILNSKELVSFVHYPNTSIVSNKLFGKDVKSKVAALDKNGTYDIGINLHNGIEKVVTLSNEERLRHTHVIGATGVGKSTLLANMLLEDVRAGNGCALFDPHGDIVEDLLKRIPANRIKDVVLIDPSDTEFPIGCNLLQAKTDAEKIVLSSDLVSAFKQHATAWGDNMTAVLSQAVNAFLESSEVGSLIELKRFLLEEPFRKKFLEQVEDPSVHYYWEHEYAMVRKGIAPLLTRIDTFLRPKIIRFMLAQKSGIDFGECITQKKIILMKLSQGLIGEDNSFILGSLFLSKINQAAQSRQAIAKENRHPFYVYIDEFQNFVTPSIEGMLSGSRKYGIGLTLAHQELGQIENTKTLNSVISNPYIRICFRLGDNDARKLEPGFSYFDQSDLQGLGIGQAIIRIGSSSNDFNITTYNFDSIDQSVGESNRQAIITNARNKYAQPRSKVEEFILDQLPRLKSKKKEDPEVEAKAEPKEKVKSVQLEKKHKVQVQIEEKDDLSVSATSLPPKAEIEKQKEEYLKQVEEQEKIRKHRSLQNFAQTMALQRGFKASIEEETKTGGRVDVGLIKNELRIAIEISVTNTVEYEVQNIQKCFQEGYTLVYLVSESENHLIAIRKKAKATIDKVLFDKTFFFKPNELGTYLSATEPDKEKPQERVNGWRVKVNYHPDDENDKNESLKKKIMRAIKKK